MMYTAGRSNYFILLILFFSMIFLSGKAQYSGTTDSMYQDGGGAGFQPSLAVVIAVLSIMFSLTFLLLVYARFCHRGSSVHEEIDNRLPGNARFIGRSTSRFSGIDRTVIDSLPFFRFSSLKGSREGLECVVCLSRFEESEILRLLPKCKHAFHIACIDQWLEKHSSCPLCRQKVNVDDLSIFTYNSNSLRQDSSLELFVERESTDSQRGSSRFSIGTSFSFRKMLTNKEEKRPIQEEVEDKFMHKFNHRIVVNDFVLKNRWSNVSSSDLMFLNSEMIGAMSSDRFSQLEPNKESPVMKNDQIMSIKEEIGRKREFENRLNKMNQTDNLLLPISRNQYQESKIVSQDEKRSMSEIIVHPRFRDLSVKSNYVRESSSSALNCESSSSSVNDMEEERRRRIWLPIARKTVKWFANREIRRSHQQNSLPALN